MVTVMHTWKIIIHFIQKVYKIKKSLAKVHKYLKK